MHARTGGRHVDRVEHLDARLLTRLHRSTLRLHSRTELDEDSVRLAEQVVDALILRSLGHLDVLLHVVRTQRLEARRLLSRSGILGSLVKLLDSLVPRLS